MSNKVITYIGFDGTDTPVLEGFITIKHNPGMDEGLTPKEYYQLCKRYVEKSSIIVVNLNNGNLTIDEVIMIHLAYTISAPIFGIGHKMLISDDIMKELITQRFSSLEELIEHLNDYYIFF